MKYAITVNASASFNGTDYPAMVLQIDGVTYGSALVNNNNTQAYAFSADINPGAAHTFSLVNPNHDSSAMLLTVQSITINGAAISASSPGETYVSNNGTYSQWSQMYFGGQINFAVPGGGFPGSGVLGTLVGSPSLSPPPIPVPILPSVPTPAPVPAPVPNPTIAPGRPVIYVTSTGDDGGDGSAAHPFASLQRAVNAAGGTTTISVASGSYATVGVNLGANQNGLVIQGGPGAVLDARGQQTVLNIQGGSNISIAGLTFAGASGPSILLNGATIVSVTGDTFTNNAANLLLENGASHNIVSGNTMTNTGGSAVEVKDGSNANTFGNNTITGVGAAETYGGAFYLHGADANQITHNVINNTEGAAINLADFYSNSTGTQNIGNTIAFNQINNSDLSSSDSGAIYVLGRSNANTLTTVSNNFIRGTGRVGQHSVGIYLDDGTSGVTATANVVTGIGSDGFEIHGGSNNTLSGNVFDIGTGNASAGLFQAQPGDVYNPYSLQNNVVSGNVIQSEAYGGRNPIFANYNGGNPTVSGNDYWSTTGSSLNPYPDTRASYFNPGISAGNYATSGDGIGFNSIDLGSIGLLKA